MAYILTLVRKNPLYWADGPPGFAQVAGAFNGILRCVRYKYCSCINMLAGRQILLMNIYTYIRTTSWIFRGPLPRLLAIMTGVKDNARLSSDMAMLWAQRHSNWLHFRPGE